MQRYISNTGTRFARANRTVVSSRGPGATPAALGTPRTWTGAVLLTIYAVMGWGRSLRAAAGAASRRRAPPLLPLPLLLALALALPPRPAAGDQQDCASLLRDFREFNKKEAVPFNSDNMVYFLHVPRCGARSARGRRPRQRARRRWRRRRQGRRRLRAATAGAAQTAPAAAAAPSVVE